MRLKTFLLTAMAAAIAAVSAGDLHAQYTPIPNYIGVGAGLEFRNDINNHLSGVTPIAPRLVSLPMAQLPTEQDGQLYWCSDCSETVPCSSGGSGAVAMGLGGQWSCSAGASIGSAFPLTANASAAGHRITNLAPNEAAGDALSQGQSHLNDLAAASGAYSMGSNPIHSLLGGTASGDALAYGQSGAQLYGANFTNGPVTGVPTATSIGNALSWGQSQAQLTVNQASAAIASVSSNTVGGGSPQSLNAPANIVSGNVLVASLQFLNVGSETITPPSGFIAMGNASNGGGPVYTFCKVATGSEPSSYSWSWNNAAYIVFISIAQVSGVNTCTPDGQVSNDSASGTTVTLASFPVSHLNDFVYIAEGQNNTPGSLWSSIGASISANGGGAANWWFTNNSFATPAITLTGSYNNGVNGVAFALPTNATVQASPLIQGQSGAMVQSLTGQVNKVLNVMAPPYNAQGDGSTDDWNAIQSAIYDACGGVPPNFNTGALTPNAQGAAVYLPATPNGFAISKPLRIPCSGINLYGAGRNSTSLRAMFTGPAIIAEGWAANNLTYGAPLVGSTGQSLNTSSCQSGNSCYPIDADRYLNSANQNFAADAANGFDVEFWDEPSVASPSGALLAGGVDAPGSGAPMLNITLNGSSQLSATVNTTGGAVSLTTGSCAVQASGTAYDVAVDWDKSNYRLFENGVLCSTVASTNAPVEPVTEELGIPFYGAHQFYPDASGILSSGFQGYLDSIRFERASEHTAAYTPPTAKFYADGNTDLLLNFDPSLDGTQAAYTGYATVPNVYFPIIAGGEGPHPAGSAYVHDMELCKGTQGGHPDGVFAVWSTDSRWERLSCSAANFVPFDFFDNDYGDIVSDDYAYGGMVSFQHGDAWNQSYSSNEFSDGADYACFETVSGGGGGGHDTHQICSNRQNLRYGWIYFQSIGENDYSFLDMEAAAPNWITTYLFAGDWAPVTLISPLPGTYNGAPFMESTGGGWGPVVIGGMFSWYNQNQPASYGIFFNGQAPSHPAIFIGDLLPSGVPLTDVPSGVQKIGENNVFNSLELRQAPTLDAGLNHIAVNALADPAAPTISVIGATGSSSYGPYFVVCHDANGGTTNVSPVSNTVTNGPATLSASDYIQIVWSATSGCASWDVLKGSLSEALATGVPGTATSLNDTGQTTVAYAAPTRNTTGDVAYGSMLVSVGMPYAKIPASVVNGGRFYCTDCDPPANPPAPCTHIGAKTGSWVDGVNSQWLCVP